MSHLSEFPHPLTSGVTLCERNSKLIGESSIGVLDYRKISLKEEYSVKKSLACNEITCKEAFKNADATIIDNLRRKWISNGLAGIFDEFHNIEQVPVPLQSVFAKLRDWVNILNKWKKARETEMEMTEKKSILACHAHIGRIAIVIKENTVKVLNINRIGESDQEVILKDKRVCKVTCLAWRPKSSLSIAAGSINGILVWLLEPNVSSLKPGLHMARYLSSKDMPSEVSSISWCPDGIMLACSCKNSSSFWIWNISSQDSTPIHRVGGSISFLDWSPCKRRLLAASDSCTFRIWETSIWTNEKWANLNGKCANACWSSCGEYLLFSVANEAIVYYTHFYTKNCSESNDLGGSGTALKCGDVSAVSFPNGDSEIQIGGLISNMAWDPTDSRLAVTFLGEDGSQQPYIALYHTRINPNLQLIPCGFVKGEEDQLPLSINFVHGYEKGALLTVYWSNEEISLIPLLFNHNLSSSHLPTVEVGQLDATIHPAVEDVTEIPSTRNDVSLYSSFVD